jgi:hypothetical protein
MSRKLSGRLSGNDGLEEPILKKNFEIGHGNFWKETKEN